ncbi:hypothetical protein HZB88_00955 [archaeon]|nr:hypothetical protein [archaeon]
MPLSEENIKLSFARVKEDIKKLDSRLLSLQQSLENLQKMISLPPKPILPPSDEKTPDLPPQNGDSTRNDGVYSFIHSLFIHSCTPYAHPQNQHPSPYSMLSSLKEDLQHRFLSLSNQEFLTFLTLYHLEDEVGKVTYPLIAKTLNLSEGCIRTYMSSLIKKGIPIIKVKINNRVTLLSLSQDFRSLNLKKTLSDLYYTRSDAEQKHLNNF